MSHLGLLKSMVHTHGKGTVFARCTYRSAHEATQNHILLEADLKSIRGKLKLVIKTAYS